MIFIYMYILHIYICKHKYILYNSVIMCIYIYIHKDFWVLSLKSSVCAEP